MFYFVIISIMHACTYICWLLQKLPDFRNQLPPLPQLALDAAFLYMLALDLKGPVGGRFGVDGLFNLSGVSQLPGSLGAVPIEKVTLKSLEPFYFYPP